MSRGQLPILICDADDGLCEEFATNFFAECAISVGGVRITQSERAPGWESDGDTDLCPECARKRQEEQS